MNICVFCSSSKNIDKKYLNIASELLDYFIKKNHSLIYGGANLGIMGAISKLAIINNLNVISVIPEKIFDMGIANLEVNKIIKTKTMHERKKMMEDLADAFIILPGGFGTLEELIEVITLKQLGYHNKPVIILNSFGFYLPLLNFFQVFYDENFTKIVFKNLYFVADNIKEAFNYLENYKEIDTNSKF